MDNNNSGKQHKPQKGKYYTYKRVEVYAPERAIKRATDIATNYENCPLGIFMRAYLNDFVDGFALRPADEYLKQANSKKRNRKNPLKRFHFLIQPDIYNQASEKIEAEHKMPLTIFMRAWLLDLMNTNLDRSQPLPTYGTVKDERERNYPENREESSG